MLYHLITITRYIIKMGASASTFEEFYQIAPNCFNQEWKQNIHNKYMNLLKIFFKLLWLTSTVFLVSYWSDADSGIGKKLWQRPQEKTLVPLRFRDYCSLTGTHWLSTHAQHHIWNWSLYYSGVVCAPVSKKVTTNLPENSQKTWTS